MSALNCLVEDDAAHIFTDGMVCDESGTLLGILSKTIAIPRFNAAIATIGPVYLGPLLAGAIAEMDWSSFDELHAKFPGDLERREEAARDIPGIQKWGHYLVLVAGWSESRDQPYAFTVCRKSGSRPYAPIAITDFREPWDNSLPRIKRTGDVSTDGLAIMEIQRSRSCRALDIPDLECHVVGGFCQQTTITRDEITTKILRRWPDKIGERINPKS